MATTSVLTAVLNKFTAEAFDERIKQANLATVTEFDTKLKSLNQKINENKTRHLLVEIELNKLKTFDLEVKIILKKMVYKIIWYFSQ